MSRPPRANGRTVRMSGPHVHPDTAAKIREAAYRSGRTMDEVTGDAIEAFYPPLTRSEAAQDLDE